MITTVYVDGVRLDTASGVSIKRSASTLVGTLSFSTPVNIQEACEAHASVRVMSGDTARFIGKIDTYTLAYSGKALSISVKCSDDLSTLVTDERISFASGTMVGDAIVLLLANTGIDTSFVALRSTPLPDAYCVFPINSNRLDVVRKILAAVGSVLYLRFDGVTTYAVCDTWSNILSVEELTETIYVSDATHTVLSFNLTPPPEAADTPTATISVVGAPALLYNLVDLHGLYKNIGIVYPYAVWRVSDVTTKIEDYGIVTDASLVDPSIDLSEPLNAAAATKYEIADLIQKPIDTTVDNSLARVAAITTVNTSTVIVTYDTTGEVETIPRYDI